MADGAALLLRVGHAGECVEEPVGGIDGHEADAEVRAEGALHLLTLVLAEQAGVDEDAGELVADGAVHERRGDARVDAARQTADDASLADEGADLLYFVLDEGAGGP